jgi:hypothetical protein
MPEFEAPEDENTIEIFELRPGEVLCAFVVADVEDEDVAAVKKHWAEVVCTPAAESMMKFMNNHFTRRGD